MSAAVRVELRRRTGGSQTDAAHSKESEIVALPTPLLFPIPELLAPSAPVGHCALDLAKRNVNPESCLRHSRHSPLPI